jgi:hypothetical protein
MKQCGEFLFILCECNEFVQSKGSMQGIGWQIHMEENNVYMC